jgi:hypothetical protein
MYRIKKKMIRKGKEKKMKRRGQRGASGKEEKRRKKSRRRKIRKRIGIKVITRLRKKRKEGRKNNNL